MILDTVTFNNRYTLESVQNLTPVKQEVVAKTPGLLQASAHFAKQYGGDFVAEAVRYVEKYTDSEYPIIVDTKIHMLKPSWLPGIPGWHIDFAPNWTNIVNFNAIDENEQHYMAITSDVSATEFITHPITFQLPRVEKINGILSGLINAYGNNLAKESVLANNLYRFNQLDLHRVCPATGSGWRLFVRISTTKLRPVLNEVRSHASQVYILNEHEGW